MKKRLIAITLLLTLLFPAVPAKVNASDSKVQKIKEQIVTVYTRSLRRMGKSTFLGFCGQAVNNQLYYLGVDTKVRGCNGKDEYDQYKKLGTTTGGYPCRAYPASKYTLEGALNAISDNGNRDVYNILVGFEKTSSAAGQKYGHAVVIYAIIDGIVYFAECCAAMVDGKYWPERSAISCSIEAFSNHYASWTTLDGLIWFGNKGYSEQCYSYDAALDTMALKNVPVYSEIPNPEAYELPEKLGTVYAGQILSVTGIFETPEGGYWYETTYNGTFGYVETSAMKTLQVTAGDLSVSGENVHMPSWLRKGQIFVLGGEIRAGSGRLRKLEVTLHEKTVQDNGAPIYSAEVKTNAKSLTLSEVTHGVILWNKLPEGEYRLTIRATVESQTVENGRLHLEFQERELWRSEFRVVPKNVWLPEITFDACGGDAQLERTVTDNGGTLDRLPKAQRKGYTFLGWYTQPEGGEPVTTETKFTQNTVVYAHWKLGERSYTGWVQADGEWVYYRKGEPVYGWFRYNGLRFWQDNLGRIPEGWRRIQGRWYHFSGFGAVNTGWIETERGLSFLLADGCPAIGQIEIEGTPRFFDENGSLVFH